MKAVDQARVLLLGAVAALLLPAACDAGGIVGGDCRTGTDLCGERCVDLSVDPTHCGECGNECDEGLVCRSGECEPAGGRPSGGGGGTAGQPSTGGDAGAMPGGAGAEAGVGGNSGSGGRGGRGGAGGASGRGGGAGSSGQAGAGGAVCLPPFDTADQCGDCDTVCTEPSPLCAPDDLGGYQCVPECEPPLIACGDQCVDVNVHPLHCGGCFNICPSGICQAGECVGATTGHIAAYCMDYFYVQQQSAHTILLGNAVFLPIRNEIRILAFSRWAPANVRTQVDRVIQWSAAARGRTRTVTTIVDPAELSSELSIQNYDVFLIHDQSQAPAGELASIGAAWQNSMVLDSFARAGGVIVVLNGARGTGEMAEFIDASGLVSLDGHTPILPEDTTTRFYNRAPGDALGINVVSPISPLPFSCTFDTQVAPDSESVFVVTDAPAPDPGSPVVVHRIVAP